MAWTEERTRRIVEDWQIGLSASQIAERIGGVSRNAVIGKIHRLGLSDTRPRGTNSLLSRRAARGASKRIANKEPPATRLTAAQAAERHAMRELEGDARRLEQAQPDICVLPPFRKTVETLEATDCRWPFGDPKESDFHFCGRQRVEGLSYCDFHAKRAYQPPQPDRRHRHSTPGSRQIIPGHTHGTDRTYVADTLTLDIVEPA